MKKLIFLAFLFVFVVAEADDIENHDFLYDYLVGNYIVFGKGLNNGPLYSGNVVFERKENHLQITRMIDNQRIVGVGYIEHIAAEPQTNVLRIRFEQDGKHLEATYLWQSDLDNYARLTGYIYQPDTKTTVPGMEALFVNPVEN